MVAPAFALLGAAACLADLDEARRVPRGGRAGPGGAPGEAACTREATALREPPLEF